jgi:hypothetical protein
MNSTIRVVAVVPVVAGLAWLAIHSFEAGLAGTKVFEAGVAMGALSAPRAAHTSTGSRSAAIVATSRASPPAQALATTRVFPAVPRSLHAIASSVAHVAAPTSTGAPRTSPPFPTVTIWRTGLPSRSPRHTTTAPPSDG